MFPRANSRFNVLLNFETPPNNIGTINDISVVEGVRDGGLAPLPGMSRYDTAVLAGLLVALAFFIFLLVLLCLCFGARKRKHIMKDTTSTKMTDIDSVASVGISDGTLSQENLHEVDIKLPRAWLEEFRGISDEELDLKIKQLEESGWEKFEGEAFRGENEASLGGSERVIETVYTTTGGGILNREAIKSSSASGEYASCHHSESTREGLSGSADYGAGSGSVVYTEIRRLVSPEPLRDEIEKDYSICANENEISRRRGDFYLVSEQTTDSNVCSETDYSATSSSIAKSMDKENYMKIYWAYKRYMDYRNQTEV